MLPLALDKEILRGIDRLVRIKIYCRISMNRDQNDIPRSKYVFEKDDFVRLMDIHSRHPWLKYENPTGLEELWHIADDSSDDKELIEFLIDKFHYVDSNMIRESCKKLAYQIENIWNLLPENTIVSAMCDNSEPDGSQYLVQSMKNKFSEAWKGRLCNSIATSVYKVKNGDNLVLVDDFIGTGRTAHRKSTWCVEKTIELGVTDLKIYICSLAAMRSSSEIIEQSAKEIYSVYWLNKGISDEAPKEKLASYTRSMLNLEGSLSWSNGNRKLFTFGYKQSESLFSLESINVPNNVFPIFWWKYGKDGEQRSTIFRRL